MAIEIGGYRIYPLFFIIIIAIVIMIILIVKKILKLKKIKEERSLNRITQWQKTKMVDILLECKERTIEECGGESEYTDIIDETINYIKKSKKWNPKELEKINNDCIPIITDALFQEIKNCYTKEIQKFNRIVLLVHAIDFINGGPEIENKKMIWISKNYSVDTMFKYRSKQEGQLKTLIMQSLTRIMGLYDKSLNCIPSTVLTVDERLKEINYIEFEDIVGEFNVKENFLTGTRSDTLDIITICVFDECQNIVMNMESILKDNEKSKLRALACLCDQELYPIIIEDIAL